MVKIVASLLDAPGFKSWLLLCLHAFCIRPVPGPSQLCTGFPLYVFHGGAPPQLQNSFFLINVKQELT